MFKAWQIQGLLFLGFYLVSLWGCKLEQRAATKLVHPELQQNGIYYEAKRGKRQRILGPYEAKEIHVQEHIHGRKGSLFSTVEARRPAWNYALQFKFYGLQQRIWNVDCMAERRTPADADYAATLDENRDELAMRCEITGPERWLFRIQGKLVHNIVGTLQSHEEEQTVPIHVEVLLWHKVWKIFRRHLPTPLAQSKRGQKPLAAMTLAYPQQLWLAKENEPVIQEVVIAVFVALQELPAGWEG